MLGGLLAAHLIIRDRHQPFGNMVPTDYNDELLLMAHDLANRLLCAFENTSLGIPYPRVSKTTSPPSAIDQSYDVQLLMKISILHSSVTV